jgi:hypothetical protein
MDHGSPQDSQAGRCAAARELLAGYSEVLDSIAAKPAIVFLSRQYVPQGQSSRRFRLPRANALAAILAELHVAARVDALLRRGRRLRMVRYLALRAGVTPAGLPGGSAPQVAPDR